MLQRTDVGVAVVLSIVVLWSTLFPSPPQTSGHPSRSHHCLTLHVKDISSLKSAAELSQAHLHSTFSSTVYNIYYFGIFIVLTFNTLN